MKNNLKNTIKKRFQLGRKKLIDNPLKIFKKINIEKFSKITSLSLKEKYLHFKERSKQRELARVKLLKEEKIQELKKERLEQEKQRIEEVRLIKQNELHILNE